MTGGLAFSTSRELEEAYPNNVCPSDKRNRKNTKDALAISSDAMTISGAVIAAVGIGMLIVGIRKEKESRNAVTVFPAFGENSASLAISGHF